MENRLFVIGDKSKVLNYNLNNEYTNYPKIVITKRELVKNLENFNLDNIFNKKFLDITKEEIEKIEESKFSNDLYSIIQENIKNISKTHLDVNINNMNFVNSISNSKFTITLRTESFTISKYYIEKGEILSNIKKLLIEYLSFKPNIVRFDKLERFHIEIYESEEIIKNIILKKDRNSFLLCASLGFPKSNIKIDLLNNPEIYISRNNEYKFFKNNQKSVYIREHNSIVKKEMKEIENILSQEDLKLIYDKTKLINDAVIEMYINQKDKLRITNISLLENHLTEFSENGFYLNKSSLDNKKISLININDDLEVEYPYPKYLLFENNHDIEYFYNNFDNFLINKKLNFEGIIFCVNIYHYFLDYLGNLYDIDIIFTMNKLQKSNNVEIFHPLNFSSKVTNEINPFDNIIPKERDELLEKLKNIELSLDSENVNEKELENKRKEIELAQNFLNKKKEDKNNKEELNLDEKESAINFFAKKALQKEENNENITKDKNEAFSFKHEDKLLYDKDNFNDNLFTKVSDLESEKKNNDPQILSFEDSIKQLKEEISKSFNKNALESKENDFEFEKNIDLSKYESVLATDLIAIPDFENADIYFTSEPLELAKKSFTIIDNESSYKDLKNVNYILPYNQKEDSKFYYLINSPEEYFYLKGTGKGYFVNISNFNKDILNKFVEKLFKKNKNLYIIGKKKDVDYLEEIIDKISGVYIIDLETNDDFNNLKNKLLKFEKKKLFKN